MTRNSSLKILVLSLSLAILGIGFFPAQSEATAPPSLLAPAVTLAPMNVCESTSTMPPSTTAESSTTEAPTTTVLPSTTTMYDPYYMYGGYSSYMSMYNTTTTMYDPYYMYGGYSSYMSMYNTTTTYPYYYSYYYNTTTTDPYYMGPQGLSVGPLICVDESTSTSTTEMPTTTSSEVPSTTIETEPTTTTQPTDAVSSMEELNGRNVRAGNVRMRMRGQGHKAFSPFAIEVHSTPQTIGSGTTDADGNYEAEVTLPGDLESGAHSFVVLGTDPFGNPIQTVSNFYVLMDGTIATPMNASDGSAGAGLPVTGSNTTSLLIWANLMILCGGGIVVLARRERRLRLQASE